MFLRLFLSLSLIAQSSFGISQPNAQLDTQLAATTPDALAITYRLAKTTQDYESFLNYFGALSNQQEQVNLIKSKLDKQTLKMTLPDMKLSANGGIQIGHDEITIKDNFVFVNKTQIPYDVKKDFATNYATAKSALSGLNKSTYFSFIIPPAYAFSLVEWVVGLGLMGASMSNGGIMPVPWILGVFLFFHSCSSGADDGVIPLKMCESKSPGTYKNSIQTFGNKIYTQEVTMISPGKIKMTTKEDGQPAKSVYINETNGHWSAGQEKVPQILADAAAKVFAECNDPSARKARIQAADDVRKQISSGDIKLAEARVKKFEAKQPGTAQ
jgi:hypothetical protein